MNSLFKKFTSTALLIWMLLSLTPSTFAATNVFKDVNSSDPGYSAIENVALLNYFSGYEDWTFKPNNNITKTEALAVIIRAALDNELIDNYKTYNGSNSTYSDIPWNQWYTWLINFAKENWIINSNIEENSSTFGRDEAISRAEFIEMFVNAFWIEKDTIDNSLKNISFYDIKYNTKYHWSAPAADIMQNDLLYVNWYSQYKFGPQNEITRREVAWILNSFSTKKENLVNVTIKEEFKEKLKSDVKLAALIDDNSTNEEEVAIEDEDFDFGSIFDEIEDMTSTWTINEETNTGSIDEEVTETVNATITVSEWYSTSKQTIPLGSNWVNILSFDVTAWDDDLEITKIDVQRKWLASDAVVTWLAIFDENGNRLSKVRDDSYDNDIAQITFDTNIKVDSWETATYILKAIIWTDNALTSETFSYEIIDVETSQEISFENVKTRDFTIASSDTTVTIESNWVVSNPKIWENKEIIKFKITWDNWENVKFNSIIIKTTNNDFEDDFQNFVLKDEITWNTLAETEKANWKFITLKLTEPMLISEGRIEKFVIEAEVVDWANDDFEFYIDETLDVDVTNASHWFPATINIANVDASWDLGSISIEAWELAIQAIEPTYNNIKLDKKNLDLGSIKVTNVQGTSLELQKFAIKISVTWSGYIDANENDTLDAWEEITANDLFENVSIYNIEKWTTYDLELVSWTENVFWDNDLAIDILSGTTTFRIEADTKKWISDFNTSRIDISLKAWDDEYSTNWAFYVEEIAENTEVDDITPSELTFDTLKGTEWEASLSFTPMANIQVVRWTKDITLIDFDVKADNSSTLTVNSLTTNIQIDAADATNNEITAINLYKSVNWTETLLDSISGTKLANWDAVFTNFKEKIESSTNLKLIIKASIIDSSSIVTKTINATVTAIDIDDEEADPVTITWLAGQVNRNIVVTSAWTIGINYDSSSDLNKNNKTLLAWNKYKIVEYKISAINEEVDVNKIVFTLNWATGTEIKRAIATASIYLDWKLIDTNTNADINSADKTITFPELDWFIIPKEEVTLQLEINTSTIGYEKIWETLPDLSVVQLDLLEAEGVDSWKTVAEQQDTTVSKLFTISPVTVKSTVTSTFGSEAKIKITIDTWDNTITTSNSDVRIDLKTLIFSELWNSWEIDAYTLYLEWDSSDIITWTNTWSTVTFDLTTFTNKRISDNETYILKNKGTTSNTYWLKLRKDWIIYLQNSDNPLIEIKSNELDEKDLWTRTY